MYIISLIAAALLGADIVNGMTIAPPHRPMGFPILVCAAHIVVLIGYQLRPTKSLALLVGVMACISLLCLFLLEVSGQPTYQIQSIKPVLTAPK